MSQGAVLKSLLLSIYTHTPILLVLHLKYIQKLTLTQDCHCYHFSLYNHLLTSVQLK